MIINKQLKTIPFDKLYQIYEEAGNAAVEGVEQHYRDQSEQEDKVEQFDKAEVKRKAGQKAITDIWIPRYKLGSLLISVMPQIMAHIASKPFRLAEVSTVEGKIDGAKMTKSAFAFDSEWERGLYLFLMLDSRSAYLTTQYKGEGVQFCSLVPLIPYAFKLHHKLSYSKWDRKTLKWVVNKNLCAAMLYEGSFTRDELLHARELGLVYQSGAAEGQSRNPQSTFKLWSTKGGCLHGVPELAQVMLTQIWCAHPSNRTPYMVLDPKNWDIMPTPLITENIFMPLTAVNNSNADKYVSSDLPWEV